MREITLDIETTGLKPSNGHKIVEFGAVELVHLRPTGQHLHLYINPERDVPHAAFAIHGLSTSFLAQHPVFKEQIQKILDFIGTSPLVIHNAPFDLGFLNHALRELTHPTLQNPIVDTLVMARQQFPGSPANLDALCRRFEINTKKRIKHGALIDSEILAEVYFHLKGGLQPNLIDLTAHAKDSQKLTFYKKKVTPRIFSPSSEERKAHKRMVQGIERALWSKYFSQTK